MPEQFAAAIAVWKDADNKAREADQLLAARYAAFFDGRGPEPTDEERVNVQMLRQAAREKLMAALGSVHGTPPRF
jgi:hypothetical protein